MARTKHKHSKKTLRESKEMYHTLFNACPLGIGLATLGGKILTANPQIQKLMGYTEKEIKAINLINIYVNREKRQQLLKTLKKSGSVRDFEIQLKRKGGTIYDVLLNADIIKLAGQKLILTHIRDITERKKEEAQTRLHSEIMKNMSEAVYLIKMSDTTIVYTNPSFEKMFGYAPGEMIGKHVSIVNAPTDKTPRETTIKIMAFIKKHGYWNGEVKNIKKDGTTFWCHATVSVFEHDVHKKVLITAHTDITEHKKAEKRIREQSRSLTQKNNALKELLEQISLEKQGITERITTNLKTLLIPKLRRLKNKLANSDKKQIKSIETAIKNIASGFGSKITDKRIFLSPREIEVCDLIREGLKNKAIARELSLSSATVETMRKRIRNKLRLQHKSINLSTYLQSL